jgi:hypothetical protein
MKRVVRTVIVSAVVISAVTAALAVAETGRYPGAKQIPTVLTSQHASAATTYAPDSGASIVATAPAVVAPSVAAKPPSAKHKSGGASTSSSQKSTVAKKTAPAPIAKKSDGGHTTTPQREVVNHAVRDESSDHSSGTSGVHTRPSSDSSHKSSGDTLRKN